MYYNEINNALLTFNGNVHYLNPEDRHDWNKRLKIYGTTTPEGRKFLLETGWKVINQPTADVTVYHPVDYQFEIHKNYSPTYEEIFLPSFSFQIFEYPKGDGLQVIAEANHANKYVFEVDLFTHRDTRPYIERHKEAIKLLYRDVWNFLHDKYHNHPRNSFLTPAELLQPPQKIDEAHPYTTKDVILIPMN